ncbi:DUF2304 family protein [Patescibacteria group bacterium]|nr:DUF2304 family protein [Patescibacteria group bacterium]MBU4458366.1 DUF2304 family protein [Patescibacteria group bacterium]MCG2695879.1 DUF2304 family protein [Candidatus Portnoybacteria bacterium]
MFIQFLIIVFALSVIIKIILNFKRGEISLKGLLFWLILWIIILIAVLLPQTTAFFAKILGVGRGVDVAIYFSIVLLFYLVFRIFIKLQKIETNITEIIREIALKNSSKRKK